MTMSFSEQLVTQPTREKNLLDLALSTQPEMLCDLEIVSA